MHISPLPNFLTALCVYCHVLIIIATTQPENIAISCGSSGITTAPDGRLWIGDSGLESPIILTIDGNPSKRRVIDKFNSPDSMPYASARISRREYSYIFQVNPGHKFVRLHFNHDSYKGFEMSKPAFTVKAGPFTLLSTVNSVFGSDASGVKQVKEYCVNIENGQALTITFSPAQKTKKSDDFYAFVNGIEVVAMPTGLYFTPQGELGPRVVGQKYRFYIYNNTALETVQRLDVTELSISPADDLMFRSLGENSKYLLDKGAVSANVIRVGYRSTKTYIAPTEVYQTVRSTYANSMLSLNKLTWRIPVDLGFRYLIRLHFSAFQPKMAQTGNREFYVVVNDHIAEDSTDVIQTGEASQLAVSRDYIVMMEGDKMAGKRNLTIAMQSKFEPGNEKFRCIPSGLEVLKLSNPDNNLAGMEPFPESPSSISTKPQRKKQRLFTHDLIATMLTVLLALLNIAVYHLRRASDSNPGMMSVRQSTEHPCRQFSVDEIRSATDNFNPEYGIGSGGYGRVYKGTIDGGATVVAVKRLRSESNQGDNEFWTEIKMLSKIRHQHLVSLIGYCNDGQERLLVYQYMSRGTLSDHFFKADKHGKFNPFLPWKVRLKVSIGAARGLNYLHSRHKVIHRDVKSSNILLDENWDAKISDFGLSKMGPTDDSFTHISTNVKGTFGYLDPEYFVNRKLTRKSDVYAFGVVLFEVLSGRPAIASRLEGEERSLAGWAQYCIREGKVDRLIERSMAEQISPACLKVFVGVAGRCLDRQPQGRPAMADVVTGLELALALQQNHVSEEWVEGEESAGLQ